MRMLRYILLLLMLATALPPAEALTRYTTVHNGFAALMWGDTVPGRVVDDGRLVDHNRSTAMAVRLDSATVTGGYRYLVRAADLHNRAGHRYRAVDPATRQSRRVPPAGWGIALDVSDQGYWAVMLTCRNTHLHDDLRDRRYAVVTVTRVSHGDTTLVAEQAIDEDIDTDDNLNALCVDVHDGRLTVEAGRRELHTVLTCDIPRVGCPVAVGYVVGPGGKIAVERAVLTTDDAPAVDLSTAWNVEALDDHFAQSRDLLEGYWEFLDRDTDDVHLRLGGRYRLAVVANNTGGYDIIYIDGAQVRPELWRAGMLKGRLAPTIFTDRYKAMWVDATLDPLVDDVQAWVDNGVILTVRFPVYNSQLRFSRVMKPAK